MTVFHVFFSYHAVTRPSQVGKPCANNISPSGKVDFCKGIIERPATNLCDYCIDIRINEAMRKGALRAFWMYNSRRPTTQELEDTYDRVHHIVFGTLATIFSTIVAEKGVP